ncbi:tetratricopeptide repeat protein [Candidatus Halobeggiatoa sp. HSG11]|nr:tetratricopeptide repeat protein [Candidatus Halobeggiatoa sp. HSG11]
MKDIPNLYNPHSQSKQELIDNFVVRHKLFKKLFRAIKQTDMQHPPQHFLIEGQRGMGKTTLLLRLSYEIENDAELGWLVPVVLAEEAYYGIMDLAGLWEQVGELLVSKGIVCESVEVGSDDYERHYLEALIGGLDAAGKKVVLFVDNIGEIFKNFDKLQAHRLREVLLTCEHFLLVGATAVTLEASFQYEHAFYEFFKKETLSGLGKAETQELLLQLARVYRTERVMQGIIESQPGRVESLRILTGGVIRTVVLLFDIFVDEQNGNAISDLESVLDKVTTLYKHRMDDLSPLHRKVVHTIALNWDSMAVEDIVQQSRLDGDNVEKALVWLEKNFVVQRVATDTLSNFYFLSERFFNIWYLMRLAAKGSQARVLWLVRFLEAWYDEKELVQRAKRQIEILEKGNYYPKAAFYMAEALSGVGKLDMDTDDELKQATKKFLANKDKSLLVELSPSDAELYYESIQYYQDKKYERMAKLLLQIKNKNEDIYFRLGYAFNELKQFEKAEKYCLMAVEKEHVGAMVNLGILYGGVLKDYTKAEKYYLMAVEKEHVSAMFNLGFLYNDVLKDYAKAEKYYLMAVEKEHIYAMFSLGFLYNTELKDYAKAEKYYLMAVEKENIYAMTNLAWLYLGQKIRKVDALKHAKQSIEKEKHTESLFALACVYLWNNEIKQAIKIDKKFMYDNEYYEKNEDDIILYLMLLIAKQQYQHATTYFNDPKLNLKDRFKPLYYALLKITNHKDNVKCPPELTEPVNDIVKKIDQMAIDYA